MNAEQWLKDLEAKADAALDEDSQLGEIDFEAAANPVAVKRLMACIRFLSVRAADSKCQKDWKCKDNSYDCHFCHAQHAYQQTEPKPQ